MAIIECEFAPGFHSISTQVKLVIPVEQPSRFADGKYPAVCLLHGGSGSSLDLLCHMNLPDLAARYGVAFIVPDAQNSCYRDMVYGPQWMHFITESLPEYVGRNYPICTQRDRSLITGYSMGGYGSLQFALLHPEKYGYAAPMSEGNGASEKYAAGELDPDFDAQLEAVYGDDRAELKSTDADCYSLMRQNKEAARKVRFMLCAGTNDFTYDDSVKLRGEMLQEGYSVEWRENDGAHEYGSWNRFMPEILDWFCEAQKKQ